MTAAVRMHAHDHCASTTVPRPLCLDLIGAAEAVDIMAHICREAEAVTYYEAFRAELSAVTGGNLEEAETVAKGAVEAATKKGAALIVLVTADGNAARHNASNRGIEPATMPLKQIR